MRQPFQGLAGLRSVYGLAATCGWIPRKWFIVEAPGEKGLGYAAVPGDSHDTRCADIQPRREAP